MAELDLKISLLPDGVFHPTAEAVTDDVDAQAEEGYTTYHHAMSEIGSKTLDQFIYTSADIDTTSKVPTGAVNEVASSLAVLLHGTLTAGQTSVTINHSRITSSSFIDYHGMLPVVDITATTGSVTVTFKAQAEDYSFILEVK